MRKVVLAIGAALGLLVGTAGVANASDNVTVTNNCNLSANWKVLFSTNYDHTGQKQRFGHWLAYVDYVVINSPGPITKAQVNVYRYDEDGGPAIGSPFSILNVDAGRYIARKDPNLGNSFGISVHVWAASGATCQVDMDPSGI
jgi:hypothetical protein